MSFIKSLVIISTFIFVAIIAELGVSFSAAVEPNSNILLKYVYYGIITFILSAPYWLPFVVPSKFVLAKKVIRRIGVIALIAYGYNFFNILLFTFKQNQDEYSLLTSPLAHSLTLFSLTSACVLALIWIEIVDLKTITVNKGGAL